MITVIIESLQLSRDLIIRIFILLLGANFAIQHKAFSDYLQTNNYRPIMHYLTANK